MSVPILNINDIVDQYFIHKDDVNRKNSLHYRMFAKWVMRDLSLNILPFPKRVVLRVNMVNNTVAIPSDYYRFGSLSFIDDCGYPIPLSFNQYIDWTPNTILADCIETNKCCACKGKSEICDEVSKFETITEAVFIPTPINNVCTYTVNLFDVFFPTVISSYTYNGQVFAVDLLVNSQQDIDDFFASIGWTKVDDTHYTIDDTNTWTSFSIGGGNFCSYDEFPDPFSAVTISIVINGTIYTSSVGVYTTIQQVVDYLNTLGFGYFSHIGNFITVNSNGIDVIGSIVLDDIICDGAPTLERLTNNNADYVLPAIPPCSYEALPSTFTATTISIIINGITHTSVAGTYTTITQVVTYLNSLGLGTFSNVGNVISVVGSNNYGLLSLDSLVFTPATVAFTNTYRYAEYVIPPFVSIDGLSFTQGATYTDGGTFTSVLQIVGWLNAGILFNDNPQIRAYSLYGGNTIYIDSINTPLGNLVIDTLGIPMTISPSNISIATDITGIDIPVTPLSGMSITVNGVVTVYNFTIPNLVSLINLLNATQSGNWIVSGTVIQSHRFIKEVSPLLFTFPINTFSIVIAGVTYNAPAPLNTWDEVVIYCNGLPPIAPLGQNVFSEFNGKLVAKYDNTQANCSQISDGVNTYLFTLASNTIAGYHPVTAINFATGVNVDFAVGCGFDEVQITLGGVTYTSNDIFTSWEQIRNFIALNGNSQTSLITLNGNTINGIANDVAGTYFGNLKLYTNGVPQTISPTNYVTADTVLTYDITGFTFPLLTVTIIIDGNPVTFTNIADATALVAALNSTQTALYILFAGTSILVKTPKAIVTCNEAFPFVNFNAVINGNTFISVSPLNSWQEVVNYLNTLNLGLFSEYNDGLGNQKLCVTDSSGQNTYTSVNADVWTHNFAQSNTDGSLNILTTLNGCWAVSTEIDDHCQVNPIVVDGVIQSNCHQIFENQDCTNVTNIKTCENGDIIKEICGCTQIVTPYTVADYFVSFAIIRDYPFTITSYQKNGSTYTVGQVITSLDDLVSFMSLLNWGYYNGNNFIYYGSTDVWQSFLVDGNTITVTSDNTQQKSTITVENICKTEVLCNVPVKECGCIIPTPETEDVLVGCCGGLLQSCCRRMCQTPTPLPNNGYGSYKLDEESNLIHIESAYKVEKLLLSYFNDGSVGGLMMIPEYALDAVLTGIQYREAMINDKFENVVDRRKQRHKVAKRDLYVYLNKLSLGEWVRAVNLQPKFSGVATFDNWYYNAGVGGFRQT